METATKSRLILVLGLALSVILGAGCESFWTDSEIWNAVVVKYMFTGHPSYNFYVKPLFDFLLFLNFELARLLNLHPMITGRFIFALNAAFAAGLFFRLCQSWGHRAGSAAGLVFFWASNSDFVKRATHLRSDSVTMTLILALFVFRESARWRNRGPIFRLGVCCFAAFVGFLFTPKSGLLTASWMLIFLAPDWRPLVVRHRWRAALCLLATLGAVALFSALGPSAEFFINSFSTKNTGIPYLAWIRFEHLERFIKENALFVVLWGFQLYFGIFRRRVLRPSVRPIFDFANVLLLLLLVYPDRLPFFIFGLSPFFLLPLAAGLPDLLKSPVFSQVQWRRIFTAGLGFAIVSSLFWSTFLILGHNSQVQQAFVRWLDDNREQLAGLEIYDAVGVIPFASANHWFLGPAEEHNADVLEHLRKDRIDVIIGSAKLSLLGKPLYDLLGERYVNRGGGLFIRHWVINRRSSRMPMRELKEDLLERMPFLTYFPNHQVFLEMKAADGTRQTRYARWDDENGETEPFSANFSLNELQSHAGLLIPPAVTQIEIMPVELLTPYSKNWMELFRFDSEF